MSEKLSRPGVWARLTPLEREAFIRGLTQEQREAFVTDFRNHAHDGQLPLDNDWQVWLIMAGRGFGKTRAGAEWVRFIAETLPDARIALVAASLGEARAVMVEGESGLLACCPLGSAPAFEPSLRRVTWPNGAQATLYSAAEPDSLRGPQHSHAWCDEVAKWPRSHDRAMRTWDNLSMGLRLGSDPRVVATTTPRAVPLMRRLLDPAQPAGLVLTRGTTRDNADNLPAKFFAAMEAHYASTALGRQELEGELLADIEGALWTRALLEACRDEALNDPPLRVVVGVDPPASERGDACGIVVCGLGASGPVRAVNATLLDPLGPSPGLRLEADATLRLSMEDIESELEPATTSAFALGANRLLVGSEILQFAQAEPEGAGIWRLTGLLRGRGGTEGEALTGHDPGARVTLLDERLLALPADVPLAEGDRLAAIGLADSTPITAGIEDAGRSRRPLFPVHPQVALDTQGRLGFGWTRRARGGWTWLDEVEQPLVEQTETYEVGLGAVDNPQRLWVVSVPSLFLEAAEVAELAALHAGEPFWVRQKGSFALSPPLLLATLPAPA